MLKGIFFKKNTKWIVLNADNLLIFKQTIIFLELLSSLEDEKENALEKEKSKRWNWIIKRSSKKYTIKDEAQKLIFKIDNLIKDIYKEQNKINKQENKKIKQKHNLETSKSIDSL